MFCRARRNEDDHKVAESCSALKIGARCIGNPGGSTVVMLGTSAREFRPP